MVANKVRVLVVEDHADTRELYSLALSDAQLQVSVASDGETAVVLAAREYPDVAVIDLRLPGMSGIDTLQELRSQERPLAAIALTGDATQAAAALAAGFDLFCVKPCTPKELLTKILCLAPSTVASSNSTSPESK